METGRIIVGIDPGTNILGYGVIRIEGTKMQLLDMGVLTMTKMEDPFLKLKTIFHHTVSLIQKHKATELSIEAPFFGKNIQSMLKLGRAQGVAIAAALSQDLEVYEYSPRKIKQSITGKGGASKEQVAAMLEHLLSIRETLTQFDATDGLAAAVCHYFQKGVAVSKEKKTKKKVTGWKAFLTENPERKIQ